MQTTVKFYNRIFGWTFTDTAGPGTPVKTIRRQGIPMANVVQIAPEKMDANESAWLGYMSVPDVKKAAKLIKQHKGSLYRNPKNLPDRGMIAIAIDSEGAIFGLLNSSSGDPSDKGNRQNNFIGSELWTTDRDKAIELYTALAGYKLDIVEVGAGNKYHLLTRDSMPRAGVVKIPWDDVKPNWIPYIAVKDVRQTITQAEKLGGRLLIKPSKEMRDNTLAIVADPSGAVFGIQQLRDVETDRGGTQL